MTNQTEQASTTAPGFRRTLIGLRRQAWVVIVCVVLAAVGAVADIKLGHQTYTASAVVSIASPSTQGSQSGSASSAPAGPDPSAELGSSTVAAAAADAGGGATQLSGSTDPTNSSFVITATAPTQTQAAEAANAAAAAFASKRVADISSASSALGNSLSKLSTEIKQLQAQGATLTPGGTAGTASTGNVPADTELQVATAEFQSLYQQQQTLAMDQSFVKVASQAQPSDAAPVTHKKTIVELALLAGLLAGLGLALVRERLDDRIRSVADLSEVGPVEVLARIPTAPGKGLAATISGSPSDGLAESVRELRTALRFMSVKQSVQTILVTSPTPGDGKSFVAANLAMAWAMSGARTVLVSCNLRNPTLEELFQIDSTHPGVTDAIAKTTLASHRGWRSGAAGGGPGSPEQSGPDYTDSPLLDVDSLLVPTTVEDLLLLPAGSSAPNPADLLGSPEFGALLSVVRERADIIVLDTPPVLAVTDAVVLTAQADGVLLVTAEGKTSLAAASRALKALDSGLAPLLGIVANRVSRSDIVDYTNTSRRRRHRARHATSGASAPTGVGSVRWSAPDAGRSELPHTSPGPAARVAGIWTVWASRPGPA